MRTFIQYSQLSLKCVCVCVVFCPLCSLTQNAKAGNGQGFCLIWYTWLADIWWIHDILLFSLTQEAGSSTRGLEAMWQCSVALWTMMPQSRGKWMAQMWRPSGERRALDLSSWRWTWVAMACTAVSRILTANDVTRSHFALDVSSVVPLLFPFFFFHVFQSRFSFIFFSTLPFLTVYSIYVLHFFLIVWTLHTVY